MSIYKSHPFFFIDVRCQFLVPSGIVHLQSIQSVTYSRELNVHLITWTNGHGEFSVRAQPECKSFLVALAIFSAVTVKVDVSINSTYLECSTLSLEVEGSGNHDIQSAHLFVPLDH